MRGLVTGYDCRPAMIAPNPHRRNAASQQRRWVYMCPSGVVTDTSSRPEFIVPCKITTDIMFNYFPRSNQRRPATNQASQRSTYPPQTALNQSYGFQQDQGFSPVYHNQQAHRTERPSAVAHTPTLYDQYAQAYTRMLPARPTASQHGTHMDGRDFDHQQHYSDYSGDSEGSSTAAVVGSRAAQPSFAPQQPYQDFRATPRAGDPPYIQPARSQVQYEPFIDHGEPNGWTTGPVPGQYNGSSYQQGGHVQHPMNPRMPFMLNTGPIPTHYNGPEAWFDPSQSMHIPPPTMYAAASAFPPTNYSGVSVQPMAANVPYATEYQSQPPMDNPSGNLSNNAIDQAQYPQVNNNENIVGPAPVLAEATTSSGRNRRGKGRGKRRGNEA